MKKLSFSLLFARKPAARPATVQVHTDNDDVPPWRRFPAAPWPAEPELAHYAKKLRPVAVVEPPPVEPPIDLTDYCRAARIVRHGFRPSRIAA
jgi:hypothetical protein